MTLTYFCKENAMRSRRYGRKSHMTESNPDMAKKLLDEIGIKDTDGDGFRELPDGQKLVLNINFVTQGLPAAVVEFVGQNWPEGGAQTAFKEGTPDEYRAARSFNQLDLIARAKGRPLPTPRRQWVLLRTFIRSSEASLKLRNRRCLAQARMDNLLKAHISRVPGARRRGFDKADGGTARFSV